MHSRAYSYTHAHTHTCQREQNERVHPFFTFTHTSSHTHVHTHPQKIMPSLEHVCTETQTITQLQVERANFIFSLQEVQAVFTFGISTSSFGNAIASRAPVLACGSHRLKVVRVLAHTHMQTRAQANTARTHAHAHTHTHKHMHTRVQAAAHAPSILSFNNIER